MAAGEYSNAPYGGGAALRSAARRSPQL